MIASKSRIAALLNALIAVGLSGGCLEDSEPVCRGGTEIEVSGTGLCVFDRDVIVETGFLCPAARPHAFGNEEVVVCAEVADLPGDQFENLMPLSVPVDPVAGDGIATVTLCHRPPGNSQRERTLAVDANALQGHLNHGDSVGECGPE